MGHWARLIIIGKYQWEEDKEGPILRVVKKNLRRSTSEFLGTFFLVLFVAGIEVVDAYSSKQSLYDDVRLIDKGIVGGFVLAGLIYAFGTISGAHFNPGTCNLNPLFSLLFYVDSLETGCRMPSNLLSL